MSASDINAVLSDKLVFRALRILVTEHAAHQLVSRPLAPITPLIEAGLARVSDKYNTGGRHGWAEVVEATPAGRDAYLATTKKAA